MEQKVYFSFFILCAVLSQGILAKFLKEDVGKSCELLDRQKRVIDRRQGGEVLLVNGDFPYVVNIKNQGQMHCVGSILSRHTVITVARCVSSPDITIYTVFSGTASAYGGNEHNVTNKEMLIHNPSRSHSFQTGIALITVNPPFVFGSNTDRIGLHSGPVLAGMQGVIPGWGYRVGVGPIESLYVQRLRLIGVPIMNHRECQNIYHGNFPITDEDFCTYHPQKLCGNADAGAPFIIDNYLVGVYIGPVMTMHDIPIRPDVFILLQNLNYGPWIMRNIVH